MSADATPLVPPFVAATLLGPPAPPSEPGVQMPSLQGTMLHRTRGPYVQTFTGGHWYPFGPQPEDVRFQDLQALARVNRYGGHTTVERYSVAEHSVRVARRVLELGGTKLQALAGLLHDGHESFPPGDQLGPFLRAMRSVEACALLGLTPAAFEGLLVVERNAKWAVRERFGVGDVFAHLPSATLVKQADMELLATERRDLMAPSDVDWGALPDPLPERIAPWSSEMAWDEFRMMFALLWRAS